MTKQDLAQKLNNMYYNAPQGEKVSMIHLFGIKYWEEIKDCGASKKKLQVQLILKSLTERRLVKA